jgi:hypothetical protein
LIRAKVETTETCPVSKLVQLVASFFTVVNGENPGAAANYPQGIYKSIASIILFQKLIGYSTVES